MSESMFGTYWYRVAELKPFLSDTSKVSRHLYRGEPWYVIRNSVTGRNHRFNGPAYFLIARMDGRHTIQNLWETAVNSLGEAAPTQDEVIRLLSLLYDADLIKSDIAPCTESLEEKSRGKSTGGMKQRLSNPFSIRIPVLSPERFLRRWEGRVAPLFTPVAFILWVLVALVGIAATGMHWPELSNNLTDKLLSWSNLFLLWLVYPFVKILHELGHAFAVKKWGGEVREMGIQLLVLTPIPYVDATASASFPEKRQRIIVAAMGMMVELLLAFFALFVWLNVETGIVSTIAYNVMIISGISTVLFNGNPLLRYDGYYIFSDLIEIPNLAQRANRYLGYLLQRYLLGLETAESPVTAQGEAKWFLTYGPISFCYRMVVLVGLVMLMAGKFFVIGVIIAIWGAVGLLILPVVRTMHNFLSNPAIRTRRVRVAAVGGGVLLAAALILFALPVTLRTTTQGVVWLPEQSILRAGTDFEVVEVLAADGQPVDEGQPLIRGFDPFLTAEIDLCRANLQELYAKYDAEAMQERVKRSMILEEVLRVREDLRQMEESMDKLLLRSPAPGMFRLIDAQNLPGRFAKKGTILGYIVSEDSPIVRAVVGQADIGLVREKVSAVQVRLSEQISTSWPADIVRIVPAADLNLPSPALGIGGGGNIPTDPSDPDGLHALETFFQLDLQLPKQVTAPHMGGRVYVRIEHGSMPIALQWYRSLRQLLIRKFNV